ncbi:hypothetical protein XELAEV_18010993mg [Xenopus laevis]|uniref:Uncharacterized protein n=1 Tax=Xenopus laevis TaxID=8355 RepID=A0A974DVA6_XENLA|nr:hypothetical protein XELAEV_18010993mg [Xenopus laevis]
MQAFLNSSSSCTTQPLDSTQKCFSLVEPIASAKPLDMQQPCSGSASPGTTQPLDCTQTGFKLGEATAFAKALDMQQPCLNSASLLEQHIDNLIGRAAASANS